MTTLMDALDEKKTKGIDGRFQFPSFFVLVAVLQLGFGGAANASRTGGQQRDLHILPVALKFEETLSRTSPDFCAVIDYRSTIGASVDVGFAKTALNQFFSTHPRANFFVVSHFFHGFATGNGATADATGFFASWFALKLEDIWKAWLGTAGKRLKHARLCVLSFSCGSGNVCFRFDVDLIRLQWVKQAKDKEYNMCVQASTPADRDQWQTTPGLVFVSKWCDFACDQTKGPKILDELSKLTPLPCEPSAYLPAGWPDMPFFPLLAGKPVLSR